MHSYSKQFGRLYDFELIKNMHFNENYKQHRNIRFKKEINIQGNKVQDSINQHHCELQLNPKDKQQIKVKSINTQNLQEGNYYSSFVLIQQEYDYNSYLNHIQFQSEVEQSLQQNSQTDQVIRRVKIDLQINKTKRIEGVNNQRVRSNASEDIQRDIVKLLKMKKNQQSNYLKNKKTDQVNSKQQLHNNRDNRSTPNYTKNDQALNILNLKTHSMFEEQSARVKKYKTKYQNSKTKLIEVQEELNNKIREIGGLLCQVSELQDELDKVKQKDEEKNKKIQYYQQKLNKNEDEILISEHTTKYQFNNAFDMLTNMANLVTQQSNFKGKNEFSIYLKELHSALFQIQKLKVTQNQNYPETNNKRDISKIEAELHLNSLQSKNEDLINQLSESKQQQSVMVSQYKQSLQTMQERLQTMRKKIMHIEQNNQQETEALQLQLQQKDFELKDQEEANKKHQKIIQDQAYEMQIMQQHIKNLQIKQDEYAQQLQRMSTIRQSNNIQIKSIDFLTSSEIDLRDEISQLDDDIQKLQINLQKALHEQTYFDKNQILN